MLFKIKFDRFKKRYIVMTSQSDFTASDFVKFIISNAYQSLT